jgi:hypothetical protein
MPMPPSVVLLDSVAQLAPEHAGHVVVTGSHGGTSAARYALKVAAHLVVFNDAGVGKDGAGIAALALLDAAGQAAAAVAHDSARIGEAADTFASGVLSHVNGAAARLGLVPGQRLEQALQPQVLRTPTR